MTEKHALVVECEIFMWDRNPFHSWLNGEKMEFAWSKITESFVQSVVGGDADNPLKVH